MSEHRAPSWTPESGRSAYGLPGRGNYDQIWRRLNELPCLTCGSHHKSLDVDGRGNASIRCYAPDGTVVGTHDAIG